MATVSRPEPFATKPVDQLLETAEGTRLNRAVGALDLTALGIGAIIGHLRDSGRGDHAVGTRARDLVRPRRRDVHLLRLAYAELASTIPVSGSAYTYAYATMGELLAWIIGWDLILEYGVSVAAVAVGWGSYLLSCSTRCSGSH